jgi:dipicolinate synthase subunit B
MRLAGKTIGFALAGSHCTLQEALDPMVRLKEEGAEIIPIVSDTVATVTTRFGSPEDWLRGITEISGRAPLRSIPEVEPIGPQKLLDALVVCPCTGNTMAKLANAITDSPVLMAAKAQLRNRRPVVLAIATNDALGLNARNLGTLLNTKNVYFVPFGQDNPMVKPNSVEADLSRLVDTVVEALAGRQVQPLLIER